MAIVKVPIVKAKGEFVEIDTEVIPQRVYEAALLIGLKQLINGGTSKITKAAYPKAEEMAAKAIEKAKERAAAVLDDSIKIPGTAAKSDKLSGVVKTEAMRLARNLVKDELKRQKIKISHVPASEITAAAKSFLDTEQGKALIEQAKINLEERSKKVEAGLGIDLSAIQTKAKAAADKEAADKPLSAKQAGMPKVRAKGEAAQPTAH